MRYDVHITRKQNWFDSDETPDISLDEWLEYVKSDCEMRLDDFAQTETKQGDVIRINSSGLAVWKEYSKNQKDFNMAWFLYQRGKITVKSPDEEILKKMFQIASKLNAKVKGDDGEIYDEIGNYYYENSEPTKNDDHRKKRWWKFW